MKARALVAKRLIKPPTPLAVAKRPLKLAQTTSHQAQYLQYLNPTVSDTPQTLLNVHGI